MRQLDFTNPITTSNRIPLKPFAWIFLELYTNTGGTIFTLINNIVENKIDTISITKCILSIVRYEINIALTKSRYEVSVYDSLLRPQNTFLSYTRIVRKDYSIIRKQNSITIKSYFPIWFTFFYNIIRATFLLLFGNDVFFFFFFGNIFGFV